MPNKTTLEQLSDEALLCRDPALGHDWEFLTDAQLTRNRAGQLVMITRIFYCENGCGVEKDQDISIPDFERIGRDRRRYTKPYLLNISHDTADFRREYYRRKGYVG